MLFVSHKVRNGTKLDSPSQRIDGDCNFAEFADYATTAEYLLGLHRLLGGCPRRGVFKKIVRELPMDDIVAPRCHKYMREVCEDV